MFIAIDIGNTTVSIGFFKKGKLRTTCQLDTSTAFNLRPSGRGKIGPLSVNPEQAPAFSLGRVERVESRLSAGVLKHHLKKIFSQFRPEMIEDVVICSVVPPVLNTVESVAAKVLRKKPLVVGQDIFVPIKNRYSNPRQVGQDRLVCAYAASVLYGAPAIVIDLGTAITMDVISAKKEYLGGMIIPGIRLSAESLFQKTALLPMVEIKAPTALIGKDTRGSILSGLFYGYGQMLQGLVALLAKQLGRKPKVVITGGYANIMQKFIAPKVNVVDPHLVFHGMRLAWEDRQG